MRITAWAQSTDGVTGVEQSMKVFSSTTNGHVPASRGFRFSMVPSSAAEMRRRGC